MKRLADLVTAAIIFIGFTIIDSIASAPDPRAASSPANTSPSHVAAVALAPRRGWIEILKRTWRQAGEDRLLAIAAGVVFYGLLAIFPAVTALVSLYGLFADPGTIQSHIDSLATFLPGDVVNVVGDQAKRIAAKGGARLTFGFAVSLAFALWSANAGMSALIDALNVVYQAKERRGFFKLNFVSLTLTLAAVASLLIAIGFVVVAPLVLERIGLGSWEQWLVSLGRWPLLIVLVLIGLAALYRFAPDRDAPKWRWITPGSLVAAVSWLIGSAALSYYLSNWANYDATYGSLSAAVGFMTWMWMSAIVMLVGAELNAEVEAQARNDGVETAARPTGDRNTTAVAQKAKA